MQILKISALAIALTLTLATAAPAADIFAVKTALSSRSARQTCGISVVAGETLDFSVVDLERRLGLKPRSLGGITVMTLPKPEQGELFLDGVGIDAFEFISREDIDRLCFVPGDEAVSASMTFIPRGENTATTELSINILKTRVDPPEIQDESFGTVSNVAVSGHITALNDAGEDVSIKVMDPPEYGVVRFDGMSFIYSPYKDASGTDRFTVCAVDALSNYSNEAVVAIKIEKPKTSFYYADMAMNPSAYAAIKLRESGVMCGTQVGGKYFFHPDKMTSRGEFLVMLIAAGGMEGSVKPAVNTGLPNDASIPAYLKPYVKKAVDDGIWASGQAFNHNEIPTRAEAVVLTDRFAKISDVKDFALGMSDREAIPDWALKSYKNLAAYRMLDLYGNAARPADALTNSYAADLVWQLKKHYSK